MNKTEKDELYRELMNSIGQAANSVLNSYAQRPVITQKGTGRIDESQPEHPYNMDYNEADAYIEKRGLNIPLMDDDVYADERYFTQTIGNVLKWADEHPAQELPKWKRMPLGDVAYECQDGASIVYFPGVDGFKFATEAIEYKGYYIPIHELEKLLPKEQ